MKKLKWETKAKICAAILTMIAFSAGILVGFSIKSLLDSLKKPPEVFKNYQINLSFEKAFVFQENSLKALKINYIKGETLGALVTAYTPSPEETDSTPDIMASGKKVYEGAIACPSSIPFGVLIEIDGELYVCEDRTHPRYEGTFDILMFSKVEAINFGRQKKEVKIYD